MPHPETSKTKLANTLTQICCAVMEYAVSQGLSAIGGIQETYFLPQLRMMKWNVSPLGMSREVNGEWYIVAYIEVSEAALQSARRVLGIDYPLIVERGKERPFIPAQAPNFGRPQATHFQM